MAGMPKRRALQILIAHAARNVTGTGRGIRSLSEVEKTEVLQAVRKLYKEAHGFEPGDAEMFNLGLR